MNSVEKTVDDIKLLIDGGDLSDSPRLRQLHRECLQAFKTLNSNLDRCRELAANGSLQAARELNCSFDPSLTQTAETLEFFRTNDFFAICKGYGLEAPVFPDAQLLQTLNTPISSGEKRLHALLQDYRKIARNSSMQQRIVLLREIVAKLPKSARWRNDLLAAERSRCQEIEREIQQCAGKLECCEKMEELYRELMAPEWVQPPKEELLTSLRQQLQPLQKIRLEKEVEDRLQRLHECWEERDTARLADEFEKWRIFCSNPLVTLTNEQQQTIDAIGDFLKTKAEEEKVRQTASELIRNIERKLADNAPFSSIAGEYNQLQLLDHQIPVALADRLKALEEENRRCEHLRTVRRCVFGVCGAVLLLILVAFSVRYTQHLLAVRHHVSNMQELKTQQRYGEILQLYEKLSRSEPKVAADPQIILLHTEAKDILQKITTLQQKKKEEFSRLIKQIEELSLKDALDNAALLDKYLADARRLKAEYPQDKTLLDRFGKAETQVIEKRTARKQQAEKEFQDFCSRIIDDGDKQIRQIPQSKQEDLDISLARLRKELQDKLDGSPYIPQHLKNQAKQRFQMFGDRYAKAWKKENAFRLVHTPECFERYADGLKKIRSEYPDLALLYDKAFSQINEWQKVCNEYSMNSIPTMLADVHDAAAYGNGLFKADLDKIMPKTTRGAAFARFFANLLKQKDLKELVLADPDGKQYFFYVPGEVRVEKLRNPPRVNISFVPVAAGSEKDTRIILSFNGKNPKTPFVLISQNPALPYKLPPGFALLDGAPDMPKNAGRFWAGHEIAGRYSALNADGPGLNTNLKEALRFIDQEAQMGNAYLKEMFLLVFLRELYETAPILYPELAETLPELEAFHNRRQRNWRAPQAFDGYAKEKTEIEQLWAPLDIKRILEAGDLRGDFICSAHARRLIPIGVIQEADQSKVKIHLFLNEKPPRESLVLEQKTVYGPLPDEVWKGKMPRDKKIRKLLYRGQVIWSFADEQSTMEFLRTWEQKARRLNIRLQIKPSIIPDGIVL